MDLFARTAQRLEEQVNRDLVRYYHDPVAFAADCFEWRGDGLTPYQQDIIGNLPARKREAVRGPHGLGKSAIAAVTVLWFALTRDAAGVDWKVVTTAGAWRQLIHYLWPELHKWAGRIRWDRVRDRPFTAHELLGLTLKLNHGSAFAAACTNPALIEGAHADALLFIYDESKAIPAGTFDACEGAFSGTGEAYALALSTPGAPQGRFYDICSRRPGYEDWYPRAVTIAEAMAAGRISEAWKEQRRLQWGDSSAIFVNRVLGEFHAGDEDAVIPLAWAEAAVERWLAWDEAGRPAQPKPHTVGVDVARSGEDKTVLAIRTGPVLVELRRSTKQDTMETTGRVKGVLDSDPACTAIVDVIGIGAGVLDRLREQGCKAEPFTASARSNRKDATGELGFVNTRSAAWWSLREQLDPSTGPDICLPEDDLLLGDLSAPTWKVMSGGKIQVESKDDIHKRLGRSTDDGDATIQAYWTEAGTWSDAYGTTTCGRCHRGYLRQVDGQPRAACPHCGAPAVNDEAGSAPAEQELQRLVQTGPLRYDLKAPVAGLARFGNPGAA